MPKYKSGNFFQVSRLIFKDQKFLDLSHTAKYFFFMLCEIEHRFTGIRTKNKKKRSEDYFFRSTNDLETDTGLTENTLRKCRKELEAIGYIQTWKMHWVNNETGKKSEKHTIAFRLLR